MRCKSISEFIMCFMLSLFSLTAFAQIKITGTASDAETGEPLSFITIQIKGTTAGTTSDMDGNYSIEVPNRDAILVYSYIGYRSQEIKVGNQTHINVRLSEDVETLDEVVVVGYGVQNKRDVTGSIAKVGSEELMSVPTSSFDARHMSHSVPRVPFSAQCGPVHIGIDSGSTTVKLVVVDEKSQILYTNYVLFEQVDEMIGIVDAYHSPHLVNRIIRR